MGYNHTLQNISTLDKGTLGLGNKSLRNLTQSTSQDFGKDFKATID
jgi:hypothetical protein